MSFIPSSDGITEDLESDRVAHPRAAGCAQHAQSRVPRATWECCGASVDRAFAFPSFGRGVGTRKLAAANSISNCQPFF